MGELIFWLQPCLFADFISCYSIKLLVPFDRNYLFIVCVYGVLAAFSQKVKTVLFQIVY